jgi:outer membrane receptor protein involved in Fe transport
MRTKLRKNGMKRKYMRERSVSLVGASTFAAMLSASGAIAQQNADDTTIDEVVVTGSLISRSGYATPTPVSSLGEEEFRQMPVTQIPFPDWSTV